MHRNIGRNLRFERERPWSEFGDIALGRHWTEIGQTFDRHGTDFLVLLSKIRLFDFLIQDKTFWFSYPR